MDSSGPLSSVSRNCFASAVAMREVTSGLSIGTERSSAARTSAKLFVDRMTTCSTWMARAVLVTGVGSFDVTCPMHCGMQVVIASQNAHPHIALRLHRHLNRFVPLGI